MGGCRSGAECVPACPGWRGECAYCMFFRGSGRLFCPFKAFKRRTSHQRQCCKQPRRGVQRRCSILSEAAAGVARGRQQLLPLCGRRDVQRPRGAEQVLECGGEVRDKRKACAERGAESRKMSLSAEVRYVTSARPVRRGERRAEHVLECGGQVCDQR